MDGRDTVILYGVTRILYATAATAQRSVTLFSTLAASAAQLPPLVGSPVGSIYDSHEHFNATFHGLRALIREGASAFGPTPVEPDRECGEFQRCVMHT